MKIKRRYIIITIAIIAILVSIFVYWYDVPMLSLSVETDKTTYSSNENIKITVTIKNNGLQERCVANTLVEANSLSIVFHTPDNETLLYEGPAVMCLPNSIKISALGEYRYVYILNDTTKQYWGNFTETGRYEMIVKYDSYYYFADCDGENSWYGELYAETYFYVAGR